MYMIKILDNLSDKSKENLITINTINIQILSL